MNRTFQIANALVWDTADGDAMHWPVLRLYTIVPLSQMNMFQLREMIHHLMFEGGNL
jgi:hypothetical protein